MAIEDIQANVVDLVSASWRISDDLESAETCESKEDLVSSLESAYEATKQLLSDIKDSLKAAKKA